MSRPAAVSDNLTASAWMIAAMAGFAIEDALIKAAGGALPVGLVMMIFGLGGAAIFAAISATRGEPLYTADVVSRPMRWRVLFEITGRMFHTLAITLAPLSAATVILQAAPLVVVASAALLFKEKVGPRRWAAVGLGLVGVLVIVQPGTETFSPLAILAVLGMLGFAGRDLASRAAPARLSTNVLGLYGFLAIFAAGVLYSLWAASQGAPVLPRVGLSRVASLYLAGAIVMGAGSYFCLMRAMRTGDISAVAPFRYTRLVFGLGLGVVVFQEDLSAAMLIGSALIVLSGLFILSPRRGRA